MMRPGGLTRLQSGLSAVTPSASFLQRQRQSQLPEDQPPTNVMDNVFQSPRRQPFRWATAEAIGTCGGRQLFLSEQTSLLARDRSTMASRHLAGGGALAADRYAI